ncbi:MAG: SpoIIE family protein phosphatase [Cytophagales bacterium]|nr:SpoIIE family protein phosphatase [Cytophagales bacterium]MDW8384045.1 SpoIIE family protein phosphatase [Flammeovirgaceae bacterium]
MNLDYDFLLKYYQQVSSSIHRASIVQKAVLPSSEQLSKWLQDVVVFYYPRDVVSGDFYWWTRIEDKVFIAVADCAGHGIPAALMTMTVYPLMQKIVNDEHINAMEVLYRLNQAVISLLHQTSKDALCQDSLDIGLVRIDLQTRQLQFSGAYRPLIIIRNNEFIEFKGDKASIGGVNKYFEIRRSYALHEIDIQPDDYCYLFSDGFCDQFGGENNKKYSQNRLVELFKRIHVFTGKTQEQILLEEFQKWKGNNVQIDDVTVVGFKF